MQNVNYSANANMMFFPVDVRSSLFPWN